MCSSDLDALEKLGSHTVSARGDGDAPLEIRLVGQDFLATSVDLAEEAPKPVRLVVLKSFD